MRHLRFLLLNIIIFSLLLFGMSLLFPSHSYQNKSTSIFTSKDSCIAVITDTARWKNWYQLSGSSNFKIYIDRQYGDSLTSVLIDHYDLQTEDIFELFGTGSNNHLFTWRHIEDLVWNKPWKKFAAMINNKQTAATLETSLDLLKKIAENR